MNQAQIEQGLREIAEQAVPEVDLLSAIHVGLTADAKEHRGAAVRKRAARSAVTALVTTVAVVAMVPSLRAKAGALLRGWVQMHIPGPGVGVAMSMRTDLALQPTYLPDALLSGLVSVAGSVTVGAQDHMGLFFGNAQGHWLWITQESAQGTGVLPEGQHVRVRGRQAVLLNDQSGVLLGPPRRLDETIGEELTLPPGCLEAMIENDRPGSESALLKPDCQKAIEEAGEFTIVNGKAFTVRSGQFGPPEMHYANATRLIWYVGTTRIEVLSNLPLGEVLRVAESMVPTASLE